MVFVLLEALERSDYRALLEHIAESRPRDIAAIADGLNDFGMAEMAWLIEQAQARSVVLEGTSNNPRFSVNPTAQ
jgi:hypothetical protein